MNNIRKDKQRIYFIAGVNFPAISKKINKNLNMLAATNKVLSISSALKINGLNGVILTSPVLNKESDFFYPAYLVRQDKIPIVALPTTKLRFLRRIIFSLSLLFFLIFRVKKNDNVIFYNYFFEYIPLAFFLFLLKRPAFLDIEDAPRRDEKNLRGVVNYISFPILFHLTCKAKITVSNKLAKNLQLKKSLVIHGSPLASTKKTSKFNKSKVSFMYSGSINEDNGFYIFFEALKILSTDKFLCSKTTFFITGSIEDKILNKIHNSDISKKINLVIHKNLEPDEFKKILFNCDVGFNLRNPSSDFSKTTFPSKVIEIAGNGLLLITSKSDDITSLFNKKNSFILDRLEPLALFNAIKSVTIYRNKYRKASCRGQYDIHQRFSQKRIGLKLKNFLIRNRIDYEKI